MGILHNFQLSCKSTLEELAEEASRLEVKATRKIRFRPFAVKSLNPVRIEFGEDGQGSVRVSPSAAGDGCILSVQYPEALQLVWDVLQNRLVELDWIDYDDLPYFCKPHARKIEALALAAQGLKNREIAERMGINENSVKTYLNLLYRKSGAASRKDLIAKGRILKWI